MLYENINPKPRTVSIATAKGWKNVYGDRPMLISKLFCTLGLMNTPFSAARAICVISISMPNTIELDLGLAIFKCLIFMDEC